MGKQGSAQGLADHFVSLLLYTKKLNCIRKLDKSVAPE